MEIVLKGLALPTVGMIPLFLPAGFRSADSQCVPPSKLKQPRSGGISWIRIH